MQETISNKGGRPSLYTEELAAEICERISNGEPLAAICRNERMVTRATVFNWILAHPEFSERYRVARELGFDAIAANLRETARGRGDSAGDVQRDKLIVDTDLKLLSKWDPKRYGDKIDVNAAGVGEIRIVVGGDTN